MAQPSTVAGFPLSCRAVRQSGSDRRRADRHCWFVRFHAHVLPNLIGLSKCAGKSKNRCMGLIILIVVVLLLVGAFPTGGYGYGYRSHGVIGTVLLIVLILYLLGRL